MNNSEDLKLNMSQSEKIALFIAVLSLFATIAQLFFQNYLDEIIPKYKLFIFLFTIISTITAVFVILYIQIREKGIKFNTTLMPIILVLFGIGFIWDIVTTFYGLYIYVTSNNSSNTVSIMGIIFSLCITSMVFIFTIGYPFKYHSSYMSPFKIIFFILFVPCLIYDFYTSFIGNSDLFNKQIGNLGDAIILGFSTLLVCLSQYIFVNQLIVIDRSNKNSDYNEFSRDNFL